MPPRSSLRAENRGDDEAAGTGWCTGVNVLVELMERGLEVGPELATMRCDLHHRSGARHLQEVVVRRYVISRRGPRHEAEHPPSETNKTMRILRIVQHPLRQGLIGGTPAPPPYSCPVTNSILDPGALSSVVHHGVDLDLDEPPRIHEARHHDHRVRGTHLGEHLAVGPTDLLPVLRVHQVAARPDDVLH